MTDFVKDFIITEPFHYLGTADSAFGRYTKFKRLDLNIDCSIYRCIASTNLSWMALPRRQETWNKIDYECFAINNFPYLLLAFNLIIIHLHLREIFSNILFLSYE